MFSKTLLSACALAATTFSVVTNAQNIVDVPLGVTLDLGNEAQCPADAPPGTTADATVLAVVTLGAVLNADLDATGLGLVGADIDFDIDVCLCVDANANVADITLPADLDATAIAQLTDLIDGLDLAVTIPGAGTVGDLLDNPATTVTLTTTGEDVQPCTCPADATVICVNATCSCQCPAGQTYNPVTQLCVQTGSAVARQRSARYFDSRQAKRSDIERRLAAIA